MKKGFYRRAVGTAILVLGLFLIAGAAGLTAWNIHTDVSAGEVSEELVERIVQTIEAAKEEREESGDTGTPDFMPGIYTSSEFVPEDILTTEMETVTVEGNEYIGILSIPSLGLELSVMRKCDDDSVDTAPGRWCGSPYRNGFVIGGHNYRSHLGKIDRLREGDSVIFTDLKGKSFAYSVVGQEILNAYDGRILRSKEWALSLFTCTLSGNKRIVVRCLIANS